LVQIEDKPDQPLKGLKLRTAVDDYLTDNGFRGEENTVLVDKSNTLYLKIDIKSFRLYEITPGRAERNEIISLKAKMSMNIELTDAFDELLFEKNINKKSKDFSVRGNKDYDDQKQKAFQDVMVQILEDFLEDANELGYLDKGTTEEFKFEMLSLAAPGTIVGNFQQAVEGSVTISYDGGHGSGFFISSDGYILTNSHVVNEHEDLKAILHDGKKFEATLIRENKIADLALLKIDLQPNASFKLPNGDNFEIGETVYAIGTPTSTELGQSISRGIVSGFRKIGKSKLNLIQTDVPVNSGNSGGALITANGELIGVVNSKIFGFGVEGISFAIPAHRVMELLGIQVP
ncbi:MAG: trypsin-like peptidase domain-containing protein, partial [Bacteroidota bacterium]